MEHVFTRDVALGELSPAEIGDSETRASGDSFGFDTDEHTIVEVRNPPWQEAFETDTFLKYDATVARPIEQTYIRDGEEYTFKKPAEELKQSTWLLDNVPYPIGGHPETGVVRDVNDIHGFVRNPRYVEHDNEPDEQKASVYLPVNDEQARDFVADNPAVSVGFWNRLDWDVDEDGIDAYQRNLRYDHVAGVERGRCSLEDGCGLHGVVDDSESSEAPHGHVIDTEDIDAVSIGDSDETTTNSTNMTDCDCGGDGSMDDPDMDFDEYVAGLTIDALRERNDAVAEALDEKEQLDSKIETLEDEKEALQSTVEDLQADLREHERSDVEEMVDSIVDLTDAFGEKEELLEAYDEGEKDVEDIESHLDTAQSIAEDLGAEPTTVGDGAPIEGDGGESTSDNKYQTGDVVDLPAQ